MIFLVEIVNFYVIYSFKYSSLVEIILLPVMSFYSGNILSLQIYSSLVENVTFSSGNRILRLLFNEIFFQSGNFLLVKDMLCGGKISWNIFFWWKCSFLVEMFLSVYVLSILFLLRIFFYDSSILLLLNHSFLVDIFFLVEIVFLVHIFLSSAYILAELFFSRNILSSTYSPKCKSSFLVDIFFSTNCHIVDICLLV